MSRVVIEKALSGGPRRSLGRTDEIVQLVLKTPRRVGELFECLFIDDEIVRMRSSDALEKVCRQRPDVVLPFKERLLIEVPRIEQPSVQWHLAQILAELPLNGKDRRRAIVILKRNLARYDDWIVVNLTLEALSSFAERSPSLRKTLIELLPQFTESRHKSVASRARRILARLRGD